MLMFKEFLHMFVVNRAPHLTGDRITFEFAPRTAESPTHTKDGRPIVYIQEPTDDARHIALGRYMDTWSRLEAALGTMLSHATGIEYTKIHVLMNALGTRGELDVITVLGPVGLNVDLQAALSKLLARIKTNNTRRNNIVHGSWILEIRILDWNGQIGTRLNQYRYYEPSDPEAEQAVHLPENRDVRDKYLFSIQRIQALTRELSRLTNDIAIFNGDRVGAPAGQRAVLVRRPPQN